MNKPSPEMFLVGVLLGLGAGLFVFVWILQLFDWLVEKKPDPETGLPAAYGCLAVTIAFPCSLFVMYLIFNGFGLLAQR